ncbi:MAG: 4Fe-4S binding protein, partial [Lachnospiraceae bacterium]|nr:4Fe-4S binding protein [Lachnospiraceae bacterium]
FNKCIGCGLCTTRCEFDAIHLTRDLPHCSDMYKAEQMMDAVKAYMPKRTMAIIKTKLRGHSEYPSEQ